MLFPSVYRYPQKDKVKPIPKMGQASKTRPLARPQRSPKVTKGTYTIYLLAIDRFCSNFGCK